MSMPSPYPGEASNPFISGMQQDDDEDAKEFFITDDEVYSASDNIDLHPFSGASTTKSSDPSTPRTGSSGASTSGNTMMEKLEMTTSNLVSSATAAPGDDSTLGKDFGGGAVDDDDEISDDYGLHIDEEIVDDILKSSDDRIRDRENQFMKKCCMYGMAGFVLFCFFVALLDSTTDMSVRHDIQNHGSAYHYDDEETFGSGKDEETVLNEHIPYPAEQFKPFDTHAVSVLGPEFNPAMEEIPYFFQMSSVSTTVEDTFSRCLGLVIASNKPGPPGSPVDELVVYDYDETGERKYLNVDLSTTAGITRAAALNLASSELAEVLISPFLHYPLNALFAPEVNARLFTIVRHPVDWAISLYYDFTQNAVEGVLQDISLEEFIESNYYAGNQLTRVLWHGYGLEIPTENQLHLAQEILRTKFVIGLHDNLAESINLFEDYFFWEKGHDPETDLCKREQQKIENQRELDMYREVGNVGSTVHDRIVERNSLDLQLYWYAVDLHKAQRALIPSREGAGN